CAVMKLAALLVEIRRLMPPLPPAHTYPLRAIYQRCATLPRDSSERRTLERLALAITQGSEREIDERDVWKLPREALGLLGASTIRSVNLSHNGGSRGNSEFIYNVN